MDCEEVPATQYGLFLRLPTLELVSAWLSIICTKEICQEYLSRSSKSCAEKVKSV